MGCCGTYCFLWLFPAFPPAFARRGGYGLGKGFKKCVGLEAVKLIVKYLPVLTAVYLKTWEIYAYVKYSVVLSKGLAPLEDQSPSTEILNFLQWSSSKYFEMFACFGLATLDPLHYCKRLHFFFTLMDTCLSERMSLFIRIGSQQIAQL